MIFAPAVGENGAIEIASGKIPAAGMRQEESKVMRAGPSSREPIKLMFSPEGETSMSPKGPRGARS